MKIIALQAENIKKLVAVEIKPDGNLVEITGRNGQGKSSVLDSIWWALAGTGVVQAAPIRKGETEARIRLDLGEIIVTRKFKAKEDGEFTSSLVVESKDGARFPSPQAMLDGLLGALSFDPLAFARADAKSQVETLRRLAPGLDFAALDAANKADYEARTAANRRAKDMTAQAGPLDVNAPTERVDEAALLSQLEAAAKTNADVQREEDRRAREIDTAHHLECGAADAERQAEELIGKARIARQQAAEKRKAVAESAPLPPRVDAAVLRAQVDAAKAHNVKVEARERRQRLLREAENYAQEAERLTNLMASREKQKQDAIAAAKLPVPGLTFGDGQVVLNGIPFAQASDAEQLRASVAIAIALNPKLRVIRVRDGSLLDEDALRLVADMAKQHDVQVWVERVGSGKVGFVLEDGHVRQAEAVAA